MGAFSFQQSYEYDIAVLRMVRPVDFQPNAIPICLPRNNDELVGRIGSVTGKFFNEPTVSRNLNFPQNIVHFAIWTKNVMKGPTGKGGLVEETLIYKFSYSKL